MAGCSARPTEHGLSAALPPSIELNGAPVSQVLVNWLLGKENYEMKDALSVNASTQTLSGLPPLKQRWNWKAPGLISDFSVASAAGVTLISTIRDIDAGGSAADNGRFLVLLNRNGKPLFKKALESQTRVQAIRSDGQLAWVSNYEHELEAIETNGRVRWKVEAACKPIPLEAAQAVLCLEDDAATPGRLFRVFDEKTGKLVFEKKEAFERGEDPAAAARKSTTAERPPLESLAVKRTFDGRFFALAMTGGQVALYRVGRTHDGQVYVRSLWAKTVEGEITDIALAGSESERLLLPGEAPEVAVLHWQEQRQAVVFIEKSGLVHSQFFLQNTTPAQQVDITSMADGIWLQGSSIRGQFLALYRREGRSWISQSWREVKRAAEYPVPFERLIGGGVIAGVEESLQGRRRNALARFGPQGRTQWFLPVLSGEGAYLYGHSAVEGGDGVLVATDDGQVTAYSAQVEERPVAHTE